MKRFIFLTNNRCGGHLLFYGVRKNIQEPSSFEKMKKEHSVFNDVIFKYENFELVFTHKFNKTLFTEIEDTYCFVLQAKDIIRQIISTIICRLGNILNIKKENNEFMIIQNHSSDKIIFRKELPEFKVDIDKLESYLTLENIKKAYENKTSKNLNNILKLKRYHIPYEILYKEDIICNYKEVLKNCLNKIGYELIDENKYFVDLKNTVYPKELKEYYFEKVYEFKKYFEKPNP